MGVVKTTIRIPFINMSQENNEVEKKRLVLFLEDTDQGLDIEQASWHFFWL